MMNGSKENAALLRGAVMLTSEGMGGKMRQHFHAHHRMEYAGCYEGSAYPDCDVRRALHREHSGAEEPKAGPMTQPG